MIGGLGGFVLPISFGIMNDLIGVWTSCFMLLFALVAIALLWMHFAIQRMERKATAEQLVGLPEFPEMVDIHEPHHAASEGSARKRSTPPPAGSSTQAAH
jgi:NNP family nitrate/nitrite transporter-like MFS transporter